ncbi:MAG: PHP domain-containing protein [Actinomycetes bacterium]
MRIDLHCHSNASDGTDPPADVVRRARAAGVDVLALTDHDTIAGIDEAVTAQPDGLTLVAGSEISCAVTNDDKRTSVHLLGYLFDARDKPLAAELARLREDRDRRARAIVHRLVDLGVPITIEHVTDIAGSAPIGRPHIARALVALAVVPDLPAAFSDEWIGAGGRAYVAKHALEPTAAVRLVRAAGGVPVLAHPAVGKRGTTLADSEIAGLADAGLVGLEVDHPDHDPPTRDRLRGLAAALGLLTTGSSDDHGTITGRRIGCESTSDAAYDAIVEIATGATPRSG